MDAMSGYPGERTGLQSECAACGEKSLQPLWRLESSMRKESMVSEPDPPTAGDPPRKNGGECVLPTEGEDCRDGQQMKDRNEENSIPVQPFRGGTVKFNYVLQFLPRLYDSAAEKRRTFLG